MLGLRFDPDLKRYNSQGFAAHQTYRNALFGMDTAGSAGGIKFCPYVLDASEMQDLLAEFISSFPKFRNFIKIFLKSPPNLFFV